MALANNSGDQGASGRSHEVIGICWVPLAFRGERAKRSDEPSAARDSTGPEHQADARCLNRGHGRRSASTDSAVSAISDAGRPSFSTIRLGSPVEADDDSF